MHIVNPKTRGAGYCLNDACGEFYDKVFIMHANTGDPYRCSKCGVLGWTEAEQGVFSGEGELFREVRVEFNFDPETRIYKDVAVVIDHCVENGKSFLMKSTLILNGKRALKLAEMLLSGLNVYKAFYANGMPDHSERILDFDLSSEKFSTQLKQLSAIWAGFSEE